MVQTYLYLALAIALCLVAGKIVKFLKLPNVTGYLVMGLIAGPYCLNLLPQNVVDGFAIIPETALGFIAFSIGAEFKLDYLKKIGKAPIIIAALEALAAVLLVDFALIISGQNVSFSLALGAIAAATAPAATLMVVKQYKADGPVTRMLLPVVALDDAAALMCFGISIAVAKAIGGSGGGSLLKTLLQPVIEIVGALLLGGAVGAIFALLTKLFTGRGNRFAITFVAIFVCIGVCNLLGWSSLLACMMMSAVFVNMSAAANKVFELSDRFTPPLFMLFFFISGAGLNLKLLPSLGVVGAIYIVIRVVGKFAGAWLGAKICKVEKVVRKYLGFTLIPQAGVAIGLATVAMTAAPDYGAQIRTVVLCATVIYELTGPIITKLTLKKAGEIK